MTRSHLYQLPARGHQAAAGRLYDRLLQHFDREQLFMDVEAIEPGVDFVKSLDEQVAKCIAFIAVIGPRWLNARNNDGNPKLDSPTDYVRVEIEFGAQARYPGDPGAGRWRIDASGCPIFRRRSTHSRDAMRWKSPTTALRPTAMTSPATSSGRLGLLPRHQRQRSSSLAPRFRKRKPAQSCVGPKSCFPLKGGSQGCGS